MGKGAKKKKGSAKSTTSAPKKSGAKSKANKAAVERKDPMDDKSRMAYSLQHVQERATQRYGGLSISRRAYDCINERIREYNAAAGAHDSDVNFLVNDGHLRIFSVVLPADHVAHESSAEQHDTVPAAAVELICVWDPSYYSGRGLVSTLLPPSVKGKLRNK